jgi:hypothetical protein
MIDDRVARVDVIQTPRKEKKKRKGKKRRKKSADKPQHEPKQCKSPPCLRATMS